MAKRIPGIIWVIMLIGAVPAFCTITAGVEGGLSLPVSTVLKTNLKSGIQMGVFFTTPSYFIPMTDLTLSADYISLSNKTITDDKMTFMPIMLSGEFVPLPDLGILPYVKLGGGIALETLEQGSVSTNNIDPIFVGGLGARYSLSDTLMVKFETTYNFIYEKYAAGATDNGALINFTAGVGCKF